ncbi:pyridoxamine 5'-phosphate oxidase family protein [Yoonia sp. 2307UL14-13]|uniref:pyridoxamine 5'-phosphate oxidase family protein n=1 Tax=Yoonia sp. 2307UL14-13 TaxID=3126506 RepID=UPI0030B5B7F0
MSEWFETLDGIHTRLWSTLGRGVADAKHPARIPTLATVSPDGWPEARTVVLRSADRPTTQLTIHTDITSDKIKSLRANPRAALHIWDRKQALQIRLQTEVTIETGPSARPLWDKIPDHAKQSYGITPPPGTPIPDALDYVKDPDPATFAILHCQITHIDAVHLGEQHRRAAFSQSDDWKGRWLSP